MDDNSRNAPSHAQQEKPIVVALMGPTAAGKTALAFDLADTLSADIISVDSALVYRGLDIGAAKPTKQEQKQYPHRLIDIRDPSDVYTVADFCGDAKREISDSVNSGRTPLLVGGTMMYFKSLFEGLSDMPAADPLMRSAIEAEAAEHGWPHIHALLAEVDPESAAAIHPNHSQRLSRALEVYRLSGRPMSEWQKEAGDGLWHSYRWVVLAVAPRERAVLHQRIAQRFDNMLDNGFLTEVEALRERGDLHMDLPAIRAVGYRQAWEYLDGAVDFTEMREKALAATRQLAKRQITWLRGWHDLSWVYTQDEAGRFLSSDEILSQALNFIGKTAI